MRASAISLEKFYFQNSLKIVNKIMKIYASCTFLLFYFSMILTNCTKENQILPSADESQVDQNFGGHIISGGYGVYFWVNDVSQPSIKFNAFEHTTIKKGVFGILIEQAANFKLNIGMLPMRTVETRQLTKAFSWEGEKTHGSYFILHPDGDAAEDSYYPIESKSWVQVSKYDPVERIAEGRFEAVLAVLNPKTNPNNPDTVKLEHGFFRVKISEF